MLNKLFGWHVAEKLGGRFMDITFQQSLPADDTGTLTLDDAEDGSDLKTYLTTDNFILWDAFAYADPGFVELKVLPDGDTRKKFRLEATKNPTLKPLTPPMLVETDIQIDYTNEDQPNDLYISFSAMRISEDNTAEFTAMAEMIPLALQDIDLQTLNTQKLSANITAQMNIVIIQLNELIRLQGGTPIDIPDYLYPDVMVPGVLERRKEIAYKEFCRR